jgi:hypothetical protein
MLVNKIENGSVVDLMSGHTLNGACKCEPTVTSVAVKAKGGYALYNYTKVVTHKN